MYTYIKCGDWSDLKFGRIMSLFKIAEMCLGIVILEAVKKLVGWSRCITIDRRSNCMYA